MPKQKPLKRKYDSSRRQAQARETKKQIVEAARSLFVERGYAGTSIEAIASQAGVSQETVYSIFKNKRNILSFLLDISVGGDDRPIAVLDRSELQAVIHDTDQRRQLTMFAQGITEIMTRAEPIFEIMRGAAKSEPEIADLLKRMLDERLQNMIRFVRSVSVNGKLRDGLSEQDAGEIAWMMTSPELFHLLNTDRGWPKEKYTQWLTDTLTRLLLP
jgi:TetR/AcrR family transcriptional regulator, regulator of autoinduction and epiphytic fitness